MKGKTPKPMPSKARKIKEVEKNGPDIREHALLKGFLLASVCILVALFLLPVRYQVNDEFAIVHILSERSGYSPDPSSQLVISQVLSQTLCLLYRYWGSIPWFGLFMYLALCLGASLILSVILRSDERKYMLLPIPALVLFLGFCFTFVSVTSACLLVEFGIFLCLIEWARKKRCPVKHPKLYAWFLAFCFLISYMLRWRLALYMLCFGGPVLFFVRKEQWKKGLPFIVAIAFFVVGDRALFQYTSTDEHKAFAEYNKARGVFNDTPRGKYHGETTLKALDKVGWSLDDYAFFQLWILYDETLFNLESVRTFTQENHPRKGDSVFKSITGGIKKSFHASKQCTLVLAFSLISLFLYRFHRLLRLSKRDELRIGGFLAAISLGVLFFMYYRFPARFHMPLYTYVLGSCFVVFQVHNGPSGDKGYVPVSRRIAVVSSILIAGILFGYVFAQGKGLVRILEASKRKKDYIHRCLDIAKRRTTGIDLTLVSMDPSYGLGFESVHPLKELSDFPGVRIFPGGWRINSPHYHKALRQMGLKGGREFLKSIIDNKEILLFLMAKGTERDRMVKYLWESYFSRRIAPEEKVKMVPVHDFRDRNGAGLVLYSMVSQR